MGVCSCYLWLPGSEMIEQEIGPLFHFFPSLSVFHTAPRSFL